jgi:hypothetical protein
LPGARTAIASRILAELKSVKRLCPGSLVDEMKMLRRIANRLVLGQGKYLSHEDLIAAFTLRSKRVITHDSIGTLLGEVQSPDDKIERLLLVEENIVGVENKRHLAAFFTPILTSSVFQAQFVLARSPILPRLQRLSELQARVLRSGFQDIQKKEIAEALDNAASDAEIQAKVLASIHSRSGGHVDKAIAVLRLFATGALTEGRLSERARELILSQLGKPGFMTGYVEHFSKLRPERSASKEEAMSDLMRTLEKAGITSETGLKSVAA